MNSIRHLNRIGVLTCALIAAAGCQSKDVSGQSAAIVNPSAEMITELERTISTSLYGQPVTLADDAFADGRVLSLEVLARNSPNARLATSRTMSRPEQFRLIANGNGCLLEKLSSGERFLLRVTRCEPAVVSAEK